MTQLAPKVIIPKWVRFKILRRWKRWMAGNEHGRWACGARDDWRVDGVDEAVCEDGRSAGKRGSGQGNLLEKVE